ncbi:MAG: NifU family protein [Candidatus Poseidoniaceae archaeon]|jgi:Fe-S cluster biogenesis protein NfuA|nr:NifU family protein [Candidatus Poseidoniaceae archaeon]
MEDDILKQYKKEARIAMENEANRRISENNDPVEDEILRNTSLLGMNDIIPGLLARLGQVRAALDGHGGGIKVVEKSETSGRLDLILDLTGACLSCGAAPGTLQGVKSDLETDSEIARVRFSANLLDTFDDLGREFVLAHGEVEFV